MSTNDSHIELIQDEPAASSSPSTSPEPSVPTPTSTVCSICCEVLQTSLAASQCGHIYHYECILTWIQTSNTCPLCKAAAKPIVQLKYDPLQRIKQYIQTVSDSARHNGSATPTLPPTLLYLKRTLDDNELQSKIHDLQLQVQQQQASNQKLESRVNTLNKQRVKLEEQLNAVQVKYVECRSVNEPQVRELRSLQRDIKQMESELAGRERERCAQEALKTTNRILQMQLAINISSSPSPLQIRDQQTALSNVEHQYSGSNQHFVVSVLHHYMQMQMSNLRSHSNTQQTLADKIALHERQNVGLKYDISEQRKQGNAVHDKIQTLKSETARVKKANESQIAMLQSRIDRLSDTQQREQLACQLHEITAKRVPPTPTQPSLRERSVQAESSVPQRTGSSGIIRTLSRTNSFATGSAQAAGSSAAAIPAAMRRLSKASRSRKKREKDVDDMFEEILSSKPALPPHSSRNVNLNKIVGHPINITSSVLQKRTHSNPFQVTSTKRANSGEEAQKQALQSEQIGYDDATAAAPIVDEYDQVYADADAENTQPIRTSSHSVSPALSDYSSALAFMGVAVEPHNPLPAVPVHSVASTTRAHHHSKKLKRSTSSASAKHPPIARGQSSLLSFTVSSAASRASGSADVIVIDEDEPSSGIAVRQQSKAGSLAVNTQLSELIQMLDGG